MKGKTFTTEDLPARIRERCKDNPAVRARYDRELEERTKRYAIVAYDGETPLIAEELDERAVRKLSQPAMILARMMLQQTPEVRAELLAAFKATGELLYPWPLKGQKGFKPPK